MKRDLKGGVPVKLDEDLKRRLVKRAVAEGDRSLNDFAVEILAEHFGVEHEPSGVRGGTITISKVVVNFDMPLELRDKINDALERDNRRRRRSGKPRLNRSEFLNSIFRSKLDAAERAAAA